MAGFKYQWDTTEGKTYLLNMDKGRRKSELMRKSKTEVSKIQEVQGESVTLEGDN